MPRRSPIFSLLRSSGVLGRSRVKLERIATLRKSKILDLAEELGAATTPDDFAPSQTVFSHCASLSLGGGREECMSLRCRKRRLDHLVRYAALYSDRVYIRNFFSGYHHSQNMETNESRGQTPIS